MFRVLFLLLLSCLWVPAVVGPRSGQSRSRSTTRWSSKMRRCELLRVTYGPHEKSVMHEHPAGVVVFLTEQQGNLPTLTHQDRRVSAARRGRPGGLRRKHLPVE